jgi:hypothetical protein
MKVANLVKEKLGKLHFSICKKTLQQEFSSFKKLKNWNNITNIDCQKPILLKKYCYFLPVITLMLLHYLKCYITMSNCVCQNHTALQLEQKNFIYNFCATTP